MPGFATAVRSMIAFLSRSESGLRRKSTLRERRQRLLLGLRAAQFVLEL